VHGVDELEAREEQLRRSRARVVAAADADRRRIERELHDGPQQRLVALAVELQRARLLARDSPSELSELSELLEGLAADVRAALAELRELAARIHPPLLEGRGLAASLRAAVARAPIVVEIEGEPLGPLPEPVAAAVYLSCLDAVENAVGHAGRGVQVRILLRPYENGVHFAVADDGTGFDPAATAPGAGLARIADRLSALGGRFSVESAPGRGTRLTAEIPLER
jgi:signal transduction histidine kinase